MQDITGQKFNNLTVLKFSHRNKSKYYGGKGIILCNEWKSDFLNFKKWAYENGYKEGLSIDRIDCNKNYEPQNCRWVTLAEQAQNTSRVKKVVYENKECSLSELARRFNISKHTFIGRINRGWSVEKAIEQIQKCEDVL